MTREEQRERAHQVAEAAMSDIRDMLSEASMGENYEPGYDLYELPNGWIKIKASHDVVLYVDTDGETQYSVPPGADPQAEADRAAVDKMLRGER